MAQKVDVLSSAVVTSVPAPVASSNVVQREPVQSEQSGSIPTSVAPTSIPQPVSAYIPMETGLDMSGDSSNKGIVTDLLEWMGNAKEKGLTAARLFPILEAYETSGMMSALMAKFILKSMSMLDEIQTGDNSPAMTPSAYSESLSELHKLVCISIDSA